MDFSVEQRNTRFMYVCPLQNWSVTEYTLFSHQLLRESEYEQEIQEIHSKKLINYEIIEKNRASWWAVSFWKKKQKRVLNIGTAWRMDQSQYRLHFQKLR
jgi:lycopene beta-cyclase